MNNHATNFLTVLCPIPDSNVAEKTNITTINVHVTDGNNDSAVSANAAACVHFFAFPGSQCGSVDFTNSTATFTGDDILSLGASAGIYDTRPFDFAYIIVNLPDDDVSKSRVSGIAINGT